MSLPLLKVGKRFLLVPNHKTHPQFVSVAFVKKTNFEQKRGELGGGGGWVWTFSSTQSYQVVPAGVMNHPAFLHHRGAPPLGVFNGLDHPHQRDVAACGGAVRTTHTQSESAG